MEKNPKYNWGITGDKAVMKEESYFLLPFKQYQVPGTL